MDGYAFHSVLVIAASLILAALSALLSRRLRNRDRWVATVLALVLLLGDLLFLRDSVFLARLIVAEDVLAFGQWMPLLVGLFLGFAWPLLKGGCWRRGLVVLVPGLLAIYTSFPPLFTSAPETSDREARGCVLQSATSTCGAAATAILLRQHGIPATESEMVRLCLTRASGTTFHGMVRGLRRKTNGTGFRVRPENGSLRAPALITVCLSPEAAGRDPRYHREWGWTIGEEHVVVFLGFNEKGVRMADPAVGFEHWSRQALEDLWTGEMITLDPPAHPASHSTP